jgi:hypothetical protein
VGEVVYTSRVRIERLKGSLRRAELPGSDDPVFFGAPAVVADNYGVPRGSDA